MLRQILQQIRYYSDIQRNTNTTKRQKKNCVSHKIRFFRIRCYVVRIVQCVQHVSIIYQRHITRIFEQFLHQLYERHFNLFENARKTRFSRVENAQTIAKNKFFFKHQQM